MHPNPKTGIWCSSEASEKVRQSIWSSCFLVRMTKKRKNSQNVKKILRASYHTLRSLGPAHLFAFNQGTDVNSTCGKVVCQTIDFSPWIFRPGAPTPILQPLCAGCRRGAHDEGCGVHNAHGEHVHVVAQWGGFLHPRHWQCSPAAAATPLLLCSAAASMASTAPLLLLLLLQQIPNFLLSDAARLRHSTVPLYSNFRKYAHPLDVKGGRITEKVFPVFSGSFFGLVLAWSCTFGS